MAHKGGQTYGRIIISSLCSASQIPGSARSAMSVGLRRFAEALEAWPCCQLIAGELVSRWHGVQAL